MKLLQLLQHPDEIIPLAQLAYRMKFATKVTSTDPNVSFCYDMLRRVSRSFALVIQQLPQPLRDAVCIFYLVLRALDTVEDDMAIPVATKVPLLRAFHKHIYDPKFVKECGTGNYATLMQQYPKVTAVFLGLDPQFQEVIADITKRMGNGMADFIDKEVETVEDYDLYCHYVAGLVGIGLSKLFAASGRESADLATSTELANHMGLFLQKTNIIRDYLEDINEEPAPRMFWPKAVWGKHAAALDELKRADKAENAVACLNELICDALRHAPHCLKYCAMLQDPHIFRFCALPQIMAAGTLAACYNNHGVFTGVVKMRRGEVAKATVSLDDMVDVYRGFRFYGAQMRLKAARAGGSPAVRTTTLERLQSLDTMTVLNLKKAGVAVGPETGSYPSHLTHWLLLGCALLYLVATVVQDAREQVPGVDVVSLTIALTVVLLALGLLLGLGGTTSGRAKVKRA